MGQITFLNQVNYHLKEMEN